MNYSFQASHLLMFMFSLQRRANFKPNLFHRSPPESASSRTTSKARAALKWLNPFKRSCVPDPDATNEDAIWAETDIIEVWFVGCHLGKPPPSNQYTHPNTHRRRRRLRKERCQAQPKQHHPPMDGPASRRLPMRDHVQRRV